MKHFVRHSLMAGTVTLLASFQAHAALVPDTPAGQLASLDVDRTLIAHKEMWLLAIAVESFAVDHNTYPVPSSEPVSVGRLGGFLTPSYLPSVPSRDPWCSDYLYWSNGTHYIIVSYSNDAASDFSYSGLAKQGFQQLKGSVCTGSSEALGADIVFADGMFCRWHGKTPVDPWR